jgi:3-hydroxybutyrate dehydrogenase
MIAEKCLKGKVAVVTGSTSGLGRGIAEGLAAAGCHVALNGFGDKAEIEALRSRLQSDCGVEVFYHGANLMNAAEIPELIAQTAARLGPVDILVNNAGIQHVAPLETFPEEKWDAIVALNLTAPFHATKAVLPSMKARRWGRIINIASAHGLVASPLKSAYVAAKHGLVGLTKVTALETARDGITCNALCLGFIHTAIVEGQIAEQARAAGIPREKVIEEIILAKHPTKEFVKPSQAAAYVVLLCTDAGASTTGAALQIDGGWTAT